jgi:hypothetical protein
LGICLMLRPLGGESTYSDELSHLQAGWCAQVTPPDDDGLCPQRGRSVPVALPGMPCAIPRSIDVAQQFVSRPLPDLRQSCPEAHFVRTRELLVWDSLAETAHSGVSLRTLPVQIFLDFALAAAREAAG